MQSRSPQSEPTEARGLHAKLVEVMEAIDWIKKGGRNQAQNYDYTRQADVVAAVRDELIKVKVTCLPTQMEVVDSHDFESKSGGRQHFLLVRIDWTFTDSETGETMVVPSLGAGTDSGDKAPYKAMTGASKYAELLAFLIPTGDDPENDERPARQRQPARPPVQQQRPTPIRQSSTDMPDELTDDDIAALHERDEKPWGYAEFREACKRAPLPHPDLKDVVTAGVRLFPTKGLELHEPKAWKLDDREWRQLFAVVTGSAR